MSDTIAWMLTGIVLTGMAAIGIVFFVNRFWTARRKAAWNAPVVASKASAVQAHGMRILTEERNAASSEDLPQGASPAKRRPAFSGSADTETGSAPPGKTVLITEDDPEITHALTLRLKQLGINVFRSPDALGSLLAAHKLQPDLLILDINIPGGNGLSVCEMLRSDPFYKHLPVIIYTGQSDPQTIKRCQELGAHYVEKTTKAWPKIRAIACQTLGIAEEDVQKAKATPPPPVGKTTTTQVVENRRPEAPPAPPAASPAPDTRSPAEQDLPPSVKTVLPPAKPVRKGKQLLVLCIDDGNRLDSVEKLLEQQGAKTMSVDSDQQGYWSCYSEQPDAILISSDYLLSKGREVLARFEQNSLVASIPLVIVPTLQEHLPQVQELFTAGRPYPIAPLAVEQLPPLLKEVIRGQSDSTTSPLDISTPTAESAAFSSANASESSGSAEEAVLHQIERDFAFTREQSAPDAPPAAEEIAEQAAAPVRPNKPPVVLCIDDDPEISRNLALRLAPYHVMVQQAYTGMDGYWLGLKIIPDVIILDMEMPDGSGNYIFSRFKQHTLTQKIPIIVLTAHPSPGMKRELLGFGLEAFLLKPLDFNELLQVLKRHIYLEGLTGKLPMTDGEKPSRIS
jgi:DNA-binding response OmpR family regulator